MSSGCSRRSSEPPAALSSACSATAMTFSAARRKPPPRSQALFEAIRQYMDAHYAEPLSRESVAQAFYLSPNYLSHLFQKCGPMGFNEYLNHIRLEQARMLLKGHDMKVKDIAHACGFADSNYFCRLFRKNYGSARRLNIAVSTIAS